MIKTIFEEQKERYFELVDTFKAKQRELNKLADWHLKYLFDDTELAEFIYNKKSELLEEMAAIDRSLIKMRETYFTKDQLKELKKEYEALSPAGA
jgi:hypothetical protein